MANRLNKIIAVISTVAMVASIAPAVFAADNEADVALLETAESSVLYNDDFSGFEVGTLVSSSSNSNGSNTSYAGYEFTCGQRNPADYDIGINVVTDSQSGSCLNIFARKYNDGGARQPSITLTNSGAAHAFENGVVIKSDIKFSAVGSAFVITDSDGKTVAVEATDAMLGKWVNVTVASSDSSTYIVVMDVETLEPISFSTSLTILNDVSQIGIKKESSSTNDIHIDNLYVADEAYVLPDELVLDSALKAMNISQTQPGMTMEDEVYVIKQNIAIPSTPEGAELEWVVEQSADNGETWSETSLARVSGSTLKVSPSDTSADYLIRLTANLTVGELSDSVSFLLRVVQRAADEVVAYYDEDFADFTGTLADLSESLSNNTMYEASKGITFTAEYRSSGNSGISLAVSDGALDFEMSSNINDGRKPKIVLSRTMSDSNFEKAVLVEMDVQIPSEGRYFLVQDSNSNEVQVGVPSAYYGKMVHVKIVPAQRGSYVVISDLDGNVLDISLSGSSLKNVSMITVNAVSMSKMLLDNLYIADTNAPVSSEEFVAAGVNNLDITYLTKTGEVYNADDDFTLPDAPLGTTVTWQAMQKAKTANDWTPSSFVTVLGTAATINPIANIANYDVKLVATISASEASEQKEFTLSLPDPMDEITGILSEDFNKVNTTDKDAEGVKIIFDLKGTETLTHDLVLPIKSNSYANTTITWTSSDEDHLKIAADGTATIMTSDKGAHEVTLTAVATYKKGAIEYKSEPQVYNIKVGYTDDIDGKYKVRFDATYDDNFKNIPSSATSNITLPSKGYFSSDITWNSSVPNVITNQGVVKRASTAKNVVMTATIVSGDAKDDKQFNISVPGTGSTGGGGGGGTSSSTGKRNPVGGSGTIATGSTVISAPGTSNGEDIVNKLLEEAAQANDKFADVKDAAWARTEINALAEKGIINGVSDTSFAPNDTVTRAQFAKMLMGAFKLTADAYTTSSFKDVSANDWYFAAVETAYNLGIINGVEDGVFAPNALITRQDMAVMVTRAAKAAGVDIAETVEAKTFSDAASIGDYAKEAVDTLVKGGIINGMTDTEFAPVNNATRAQAAKILYNFAK